MEKTCPSCGVLVEEVKDADWEDNGIVYLFPVNKKLSQAVVEHDIPFKCKVCGSIKMNARPIRDVVVLWPAKAPEKVGSIFLPDDKYIGGSTKERMRESTAIVLAFGPGFMTKKGKWIPTTLEVGQKVYYNKNVPWRVELKDDDGKEHTVTLCGFQDIAAVEVDE